MGIMQYDGVTFDNVDDLIQYKRSVAQPKVIEQKIDLESVKPTKRSKRKFLADFDEQIKKAYSEKTTQYGLLKRKTMRSLIRLTGCTAQSISTYAGKMGYTRKTKRDKRLIFTRADRDFIHSNHKSKTIAEIADKLGVKPKQITNYLYRNKLKGNGGGKGISNHKNGELSIFPLTAQSNEVLRTMLIDAKMRGSHLNYNIAKANLSLVDDREWSETLWDDVCQQIMRSKGILDRFGIRLLFNPNDGKLSVFKAR